MAKIHDKDPTPIFGGLEDLKVIQTLKLYCWVTLTHAFPDMKLTSKGFLLLKNPCL